MDQSEITALLDDGSPEALDRLFPVVYEELMGVARRQRRSWDGNATLNTTALVHEAYLKLAGGPSSATSRAHFLALAARAMRQILVNYAERKSAIKRGGGAPHTGLDALSRGMAILPTDMSDERALSILDLNTALDRLAAENDELARVVECRVFGQMSREETARALGVSEATVKRRTRLAETWLYRELSGRDS